MRSSTAFIFGDFHYEIINDQTVRVTCGEDFDVCIPIRDLDRGVARYERTKAEWRARRAEVVDLRAKRRGHAARS